MMGHDDLRKDQIMDFISKYDAPVRERLRDFKAYNVNEDKLNELLSHLPEVKKRLKDKESEINKFKKNNEFKISFNGQIKFD
jgi:hypothetical protein